MTTVHHLCAKMLSDGKYVLKRKKKSSAWSNSPRVEETDGSGAADDGDFMQPAELKRCNYTQACSVSIHAAVTETRNAVWSEGGWMGSGVHNQAWMEKREAAFTVAVMKRSPIDSVYSTTAAEPVSNLRDQCLATLLSYLSGNTALRMSRHTVCYDSWDNYSNYAIIFLFEAWVNRSVVSEYRCMFCLGNIHIEACFKNLSMISPPLHPRVVGIYRCLSPVHHQTHTHTNTKGQES